MSTYFVSISTLMVACLCFAGHAFAWEVDDVTCAVRAIEDATPALNAETNRRLQIVTELSNLMNSKHLKRYKRMREIRRKMINFDNEAQQIVDATPDPDDQFSLEAKFGFLTDEELNQTEPCSVVILGQFMQAEVAGAWTKNLETWAMEAPISKCGPRISESVYMNFTTLESPVARAVDIHPVISVGGKKIGVDKLSHFMTEGNKYWKSTRPGYDVRKALAIGIEEEEGAFGLSTTGIKSFADMAANYKGFLFFQNLVDGPNPYFRCDDGKWKLIRQFDWAEHVDASMDESVNCNAYDTPAMQKKVDLETAKRWAKTAIKESQCPRSRQECIDLAGSFTSNEVRDTVLHPRCLRAANLSAPPELSVGYKKVVRGTPKFKDSNSSKKDTLPKQKGGQVGPSSGGSD